MMVVMTMTTLFNNYWTFNYNRTLNNDRSFYDYWSVVVMTMMSYIYRFNNHRVMMMSAMMMVVNYFNTMVRTMMMMLCRN
jgi:hypothetical protein